MVELGLTARSDASWFWRRRTTDVRGWEGNEPAEQYMLAYMIRVVQLAAGDDWIPSRIKLESPASGWGGATARFSGARIEFDQPALEIELSPPLLQLPIRAEDFGCALSPDEEDPLPVDFEGSLRYVVRPLVAGYRPSLEQISELVGRSPRTIRRWLAQAGTSWRQILDDVLFGIATDRLADERLSIVEVASELGYSSQAHFTRSFSRRAGIPPSTYRTQRLIADS
jgi:AraC-like DNA-binding protein